MIFAINGAALHTSMANLLKTKLLLDLFSQIVQLFVVTAFVVVLIFSSH